MRNWILSVVLLALASQQSSAATCRFFTDQFFGYTCALQNAHVTQENEVLDINTSNHMQGRSDNDVRAFSVDDSATLEFFPNSVLRQFTNIRYLLLENAGMTNFTPAALAGCANIVVLHLTDNLIQTVPAGVFADCSDLLILEMSNNLITEIHDDAFAELSQLLELDINHNRLTSISANIFRNLVNLQELNLRFNQISEIEDGAFSTLDELIIFYLRHNLITELRPEMFADEILSLVFFNLNENQLTRIPRLPSRAPRLKYIYLTGNQIPEIGDDDFSFAYSNITNIELSDNILTTLSSVPFENLPNLDILAVNYNRITAVDNELFDRVSSLYTFYMLGNHCASVRFDNIRSINQERQIEEALDRCYYHFFEPVVTQTCDFIEDDQFGYTCVLSGVTFRNFRDKFAVDGMHIREMVNDDITGIRIVNSNLARVPPSLFSIFPNAVNLAITDSGISRIERETFEECGLIRVLDLSRNNIRRLSTQSFENCFFVEELILDDNQITEIQPCNSFMLNIYQTRRLSMRNNICVDQVFQDPAGEWLINDFQNLVYRFINRCFSLWFMFQDESGPPPPPPPPPPPGTTTTPTPLREL